MSSVFPQTRAVVRPVVIIAGVAVRVLGLQKLAAWGRRDAADRATADLLVN